jgi:hypothetical protein
VESIQDNTAQKLHQFEEKLYPGYLRSQATKKAWRQLYKWAKLWPISGKPIQLTLIENGVCLSHFETLMYNALNKSNNQQQQHKIVQYIHLCM